MNRIKLNSKLDALLEDIEQFRGMKELKQDFQEIDTSLQAIERIRALNLSAKDFEAAVFGLENEIQAQVTVIHTKVIKVVNKIQSKVKGALANNLTTRATSYQGESRGSVGYSG